MTSSEMFSSPRTCEIVGITYRQLDYWARTGLFVPTEAASGSGSRRQYSFSDLVHLRVIKKMLDSGMKLQEVKRATDYLIAQGQSVTNADLVMTSDSVFLHDASQPEALYDLVRSGQGVFTIVALSQATDEVTTEIDRESVELTQGQIQNIA
ncbi:MAG TPA: MerR family transcriptional regulator [Acidimicrobiia bacterium]|nr:MerR family transcriptional regulator [Acidimicrobiia bacterium]